MEQAKITKRLALAGVTASRVFAIAVLGLLLIFPFFKGQFLGLIPLAAGFIGAMAFHPGAQDALAEWTARLLRRRFLVWVLLVQPTVQFALILVMRPEPWLDARFVFNEASALVSTGHMSALTYYAPAQTWWYAAFFFAFGASPLVAQVSLIPLSLGITMATYRLGRAGGLGEGRARTATLLVAAYPSLWGQVLVTPYYFYLYTVLILLAALAWIRSAADAGARWRWQAWWGGVASGLGALTKAVLLIAPAQVLALWMVLLHGFFRRAVWERWVLFMLGMIMVVGPWTLRNVEVFGEPVLVNTSGGLVLHSANNPVSNGLYSSLPDQVHVTSPSEMLDHARRSSEQARSFITHHPGSFLRLVGLKLLHTWGNETTFAELVNWRGQSSVWLDRGFSFVFQTGWAFLVFLWAARAFRDLRMKSSPGPVEVLQSIVVMSNMLVYCVYEGGARHHLPLVPLLVLYTLSKSGPPSADGR